MRASWRFFDAAFGRYAATSVLATGTDFALASSLHGLGAPAAVATFFGCVAGGGLAFAVSRGWAFQARRSSAMAQLGRFLFVWLASALLNSGLVGVLFGWFGSFAAAWALVRVAVYLGWNYPMARWFVFSGKTPQAELSGP